MTDKPTIRAEALRLFAALQATGAQVVETDILQPADTLLDLYGEDIRARAYVTGDPDRGELMLRPDFTVPVAQMHIANGAGGDAARYTYMGEVFRKQESRARRASEYLQVGFELYDPADPAAADAEVFALFAGILLPRGLQAVTGDIGILMAAVDSLGTSERRKRALRRHIWRPRRFRTLLDRFTGKSAPLPARIALLEAAKGGVARLIEGAGPLIGNRSEAEIAARVAHLREDAEAAPISGAEAEVLDVILGLRDMLPSALAQLRDVAVDLPGVSGAVERLARRAEALAAAGIDVDALPFEASYGRTTMEYYDGFVFGFLAPGSVRQPAIASGGRYDALTRVLGGGRAMPAVGAVIRPELLLAFEGEDA